MTKKIPRKKSNKPEQHALYVGPPWFTPDPPKKPVDLSWLPKSDVTISQFEQVDRDLKRAKQGGPRRQDYVAFSGFKPSYILDWWLVVRQEYHDTLGWQYHDRFSNAAYSYDMSKGTIVDTAGEAAWDEWHIDRCDEALAELDKVEVMLNALFDRAAPAPSNRERTPPPASTIDLSLLLQQKQAVLRAIKRADKRDTELLDGVLNLLDHLHDDIDPPK